MKKFLALMLCAVMMLCMFAACSTEGGETLADDAAVKEQLDDEVEEVNDSDLEYVKEKGTLVVGMTDYAPMNYKDENGEWTGFDTEFALLFGEKLGVTVEFLEINWDNKYNELKSKGIDCIWNGMTITDEGKANASISDPYVHNAQVIVMATDKLDDYADAASMADLKFAVENGSAGKDAAEANSFANVTVVDTQAKALLEVASGSADACIIDITMADAMTGEGTSYADFGYNGELTSEEYGVAFRQESDLTDEFNSYMAELIADGTLDELAAKYEINIVK